jgi:hypothetical protein
MGRPISSFPLFSRARERGTEKEREKSKSVFEKVKIGN